MSPVTSAAATSGTGTCASWTSFSVRPKRGRICFVRVRYCMSNLVTMPKRLPLRSAHDLTFGAATIIAQFADDAATITLSMPAER